MCAIEVITSQERAVQITKVTGERITVLVHVWNETVSNLTLMALGSFVGLGLEEVKPKWCGHFEY